MNLSLRNSTEEELVLLTNQLEDPSDLEQELSKRLELRIRNANIIRQMLEDIEELL